MDWKWSSAILAELLDNAGGSPWDRWKADRLSQGLPVLDGADRQPVQRIWMPKEQYRASIQRLSKKSRSNDVPDVVLSREVEADLEKARSGLGARAILP
jgi:hypothetical protein